MRSSLLIALSLVAASLLLPAAASRADPPRPAARRVVVLPTVHIHARGGPAFLTIARSRPETREEALRADLVRAVPRSVRGAPF